MPDSTVMNKQLFYTGSKESRVFVCVPRLIHKFVGVFFFSFVDSGGKGRLVSAKLMCRFASALWQTCETKVTLTLDVSLRSAR